MGWNKPNILTHWHHYIANQYKGIFKEYKRYRCKIVGMETDERTKEISLWVMISGVKNQIIRYFPKELIIEDCIFGEFSPFDARAITFYALMQEKYAGYFCPEYSISGQEFSDGKTVFILKEPNNTESRKSAKEIYCNMELLSQFSQEDLINIVSTAIQEQTIEDLQKIEN